jgi:hypothetical protein
MIPRRVRRPPPHRLERELVQALAARSEYRVHDTLERLARLFGGTLFPYSHGLVRQSFLRRVKRLVSHRDLDVPLEVEYIKNLTIRRLGIIHTNYGYDSAKVTHIRITFDQELKSRAAALRIGQSFVPLPRRSTWERSPDSRAVVLIRKARLGRVLPPFVKRLLPQRVVHPDTVPRAQWRPTGRDTWLVLALLIAAAVMRGATGWLLIPAGLAWCMSIKTRFLRYLCLLITGIMSAAAGLSLIS